MKKTYQGRNQNISSGERESTAWQPPLRTGNPSVDAPERCPYYPKIAPSRQWPVTDSSVPAESDSVLII